MSDFAIWSDRNTIANCLKSLGMNAMVRCVLDPKESQDIIKSYLNTAIRIAKQKNRQDVLETLEFAGLIYG